jgi:hypothetical protein
MEFIEKCSNDAALIIEMSPAALQRVRVLVLSAQPEDEILQALLGHLRIIEDALDVQNVHEVPVGEERLRYQREQIHRADIVVPLLSVEFLQSDMERLISQMRDARAALLPVLDRPFALAGTKWGKLQMLPKDRIPLRSRIDRDNALAEIAEEVRCRAAARKKR